MKESDRRLEFSLPNDSWVPTEPPEGMLFLLQRAGEFARFRPNIAADIAELRPEASLTDAADAVTNRLRRFDDEPRVLSREVREGEIQTVVQLVGITVRIDSATVELAQLQSLIELQKINGPRRWAACVTLTAEADAIKAYADDYHTLLTTVRAVEAQQQSRSGSVTGDGTGTNARGGPDAPSRR